MQSGINPLIDCCFKKIFGSESNKNLLSSMVNAVLEESGEPRVVELEILNPYNPKDFLGDKLSIVDLKAKNEKGEWFLIEVQIQMYSYFPQRLLYYWAKNYQLQLREGEKYHLLRKVNLISVCQESLPIGTKRYFNLFRVQDVNRQVPLSDHLSIYTLELPKFTSGKETIMKQLERWMYFLKYGESLDEDALPGPLDTPEIRQAVGELKKFTLDEVQRGVYESRLKAVMDEKSKMYDNYLTGLQEGEEIGLQKGEEIGLQKGEEIGLQKGKLEGKIEGIEASLEIKFGANGLTLMEKVRMISDIERLTRFQQRIKAAQTVDELKKDLQDM